MVKNSKLRDIYTERLYFAIETFTGRAKGKLTAFGNDDFQWENQKNIKYAANCTWQ